MDFEEFVDRDARRVRRALVSFYGADVGNEAADEAMAIAWERWASLAGMANPAGYVFRIGQTKAQPHVRWKSRRSLLRVDDSTAESVDVAGLVDLLNALERLSPDQRTAVMMVKSFGYGHRDVAELLGVSESVVNNLVHRGVVALRADMEVHP